MTGSSWFSHEWTSYRNYAKDEIIRLQTVQALRYMDLSLAQIQKILMLDDLDEVVEYVGIPHFRKPLELS